MSTLSSETNQNSEKNTQKSSIDSPTSSFTPKDSHSINSTTTIRPTSSPVFYPTIALIHETLTLNPTPTVFSALDQTHNPTPTSLVLTFNPTPSEYFQTFNPTPTSFMESHDLPISSPSSPYSTDTSYSGSTSSMSSLEIGGVVAILFLVVIVVGMIFKCGSSKSSQVNSPAILPSLSESFHDDDSPSIGESDVPSETSALLSHKETSLRIRKMQEVLQNGKVVRLLSSSLPPEYVRLVVDRHEARWVGTSFFSRTSDKLSLRDLMAVTWGCQSKAQPLIPPNDEPLNDKLCFSMVSEARTVTILMPDKQSRDIVTLGLIDIVNIMKSSGVA